MPQDSSAGKIQFRTIDDVTLVTVTGSPSAEKFLNALRGFYHGKPTLIAIWDLRNGSTENLSQTDLRTMVEIVKEKMLERKGGKTGIIAPKDLDYGMGRILQAFNEINQFPIGFQVFRTTTAAAEWLGVDLKKWEIT